MVHVDELNASIPNSFNLLYTVWISKEVSLSNNRDGEWFDSLLAREIFSFLSSTSIHSANRIGSRTSGSAVRKQARRIARAVLTTVLVLQYEHLKPEKNLPIEEKDECTKHADDIVLVVGR